MWQSYEVFIVWTKYLANTSSFYNKLLPLYKYILRQSIKNGEYHRNHIDKSSGC